MLRCDMAIKGKLAIGAIRTVWTAEMSLFAALMAQMAIERTSPQIMASTPGTLVQTLLVACAGHSLRIHYRVLIIIIALQKIADGQIG